MKTKYQNFYLKTSSFLVVKFSVYLNRRVCVMLGMVSNLLTISTLTLLERTGMVLSKSLNRKVFSFIQSNFGGTIAMCSRHC